MQHNAHLSRVDNGIGAAPPLNHDRKIPSCNRFSPAPLNAVEGLKFRRFSIGATTVGRCHGELNNRIARLEMRSEQVLIHLRSADRSSPPAREARADRVQDATGARAIERSARAAGELRRTGHRGMIGLLRLAHGSAALFQGGEEHLGSLLKETLRPRAGEREMEGQLCFTREAKAVRPRNVCRQPTSSAPPM